LGEVAFAPQVHKGDPDHNAPDAYFYQIIHKS